MSDLGKTMENDTMNKSVKDAAENNETVEFRIGFIEETVLGKKNTPALKLGLKCRDKNGTELDNWLTPVLWGTEKSNYFNKFFTDSLNVQTIVSWDSGEWLVSEDVLKGATGECELSINDAGYPQVSKWIPQIKVEPEIKKDKEEEQKEKIEKFDDEIPF